MDQLLDIYVYKYICYELSEYTIYSYIFIYR